MDLENGVIELDLEIHFEPIERIEPEGIDPATSKAKAPIRKR